MNATTYINNAHKALSLNPGGLTLEELSGKLRAKALKVSQQIRELHDAGLIETTEDAGQPVYKLKAAPAAKSGRADIQPPQYDPASVAFPAKEPVDAMGIPISCGKPLCSPGDHHLLCKLHTSDIESAPSGLLIVKDGEPLKAASKAERVLTPEAEAEREDFEAKYGMLGNCSCHISPPCGSCIHPGNPRNQEEDETAWMAAGDSEGGETDAPAWATDPALQYLAPEDYEMPPADPVLLAMANKMLGDRLDGVAHVLRGCGLPLLADASGAEDLQPKVAALSGAYQMALADLQARTDSLSSACSVLGNASARLGLDEYALPGQLLDAIDTLRADLRAAMESRSQAINEADRLRAELATERQARKALQEQGNATDVTAAAVGYLVRVPKRPPMIRRKPEAARLAALGAVRAGASRAEVLAVVPVGAARRGAEWV